MSYDLDKSIDRLIAFAKARGYVTVDELNAALPHDRLSLAELEKAMARLGAVDITLLEDAPAGGWTDIRPVRARRIGRREFSIVSPQPRPDLCA